MKYVLPSYDSLSLRVKSCPRDTVNKTVVQSCPRGTVDRTVVTPAGLVANFRTDLKRIDFRITHL